VNDPVAMKAIVVVVVVPSENRAEGLVRPAYRGDGRGASREAFVLRTSLRWGTHPRKTARPGPSPAGEWKLCRFRVNRTNIKNILESSTKWPTGRTVNEQNRAAANREVSK
jgi:hypothetical protein